MSSSPARLRRYSVVFSGELVFPAINSLIATLMEHFIKIWIPQKVGLHVAPSGSKSSWFLRYSTDFSAQPSSPLLCSAAITAERATSHAYTRSEFWNTNDNWMEYKKRAGEVKKMALDNFTLAA
ncbi:hypothetical protein LXL04_017211 [Taraxacum kok-saghyz]